MVTIFTKFSFFLLKISIVPRILIVEGSMSVMHKILCCALTRYLEISAVVYAIETRISNRNIQQCVFVSFCEKKIVWILKSGIILEITV